jgi:hypothetical protein
MSLASAAHLQGLSEHAVNRAWTTKDGLRRNVGDYLAAVVAVILFLVLTVLEARRLCTSSGP